MKYYFLFKQKIKETYLKKLPNIGKVLMFHQVTDNITMWKEENFCITEKSFEKLLIKSIENKCTFNNIYEIEKSKPQCRYITFDDGYEDVYTKALPILKKLNIPFAVFITTDFINKRGYLTVDMVKHLSKETLCTIGSHTKSHPSLRQENKDNAKQEILQSKHVLEALIHKPVYFFAFPYGSVYACSKRDIDLVKNCGYKLAFSTLNAHISEKVLHKKYFIPRINVNEKNFINIWR